MSATATSPEERERVVARATEAAPAWASASPRDRAQALVAMADALEQEERDLVATAREETGLSQQRLSAELRRTAVQLRMFATTVIDGAYLDVRIDQADPRFALGTRADIRRLLIPVGPVVNFAASNFPFAFSVAGGDTASALAAGCPVIVKAHSGHPRLSAQTAQIVSAALDQAGAPAGLLQIVFGQEAGRAVLEDRRVAAGSFTGSTGVGRMLADIAASRPAPIPFFGELGSVNPVFVTAAALKGREGIIADGYLASVSGSAGQLCTKPGFLFVPDAATLTAHIAARAGTNAEHRLLNPGITAGYAARRHEILSTPGADVVLEGGLRIDADGHGWALPTIVSVTADVLSAHRSTLLDEAFGPLSIVVEYEPDTLLTLVGDLFEGSLTGTVHAGDDEDDPELHALVHWLSRHAGRVLLGGWPTGVAVTPAMQHGGPWPATTNDSSTSVGSAAIARFLRPVAFQDAPQRLLPIPLRDDNPWAVPRSVSRAGQSTQWGAQ